MPSYQVASTQQISGEGEATLVVDAARVTITAYPPGQGSVGTAPPRLPGLGRIGYLAGDYRDTGQTLEWENRLLAASPAGATGIWWSLLPGVVADLEILLLVSDSYLDTASLASEGAGADRPSDLILT